MEFLPEAGEVESKTTSRMRTYLEGKPEEDNSHDTVHIHHTIPQVMTLEYTSVVSGCGMLSPASGRQGA